MFTQKFHRMISLATAGIAVSMLFGCATIQNGGAPAPLSITGRDLIAAGENLADEGDLAIVLKRDVTTADRNAFINARLVSLDINYYSFVSSLSVERQNADAAVQVAQIALGVAGISTAAARVKTNLAAATAALTGVKAIVDKEYYFNKSIPALLAMMNAQRFAVLQKIKTSMNDSADQYDARAVMDDLSAYQRAGTLIGAISAVETLANALEEQKSGEVRQLVAYTAPQVDEKRELNVALAALRVPANEAAARVSLDTVGKVFGVVPDPKLAYDKAFATVWRAFRSARPSKLPALRAALKDQKLLTE